MVFLLFFCSVYRLSFWHKLFRPTEKGLYSAAGSSHNPAGNNIEPVNQAQQSVYQQFQMVQELRRNETRIDRLRRC